MARPKKSVDNSPMNEQIEMAFWNLLQRKPISKISVSEIIKEAHCNRSTFYYYYADVNHLTPSIIEKIIPSHIPNIAFLYLAGDIKTIDLDIQSRESIEKICLILNHSDSHDLVKSIENAIISLWVKQFHIDEATMNDDLKYTMEFLAGGIVSVLSRYAYPLKETQMISCFKQINSLLSKQVIQFIKENL